MRQLKSVTNDTIPAVRPWYTRPAPTKCGAAALGRLICTPDRQKDGNTVTQQSRDRSRNGNRRASGTRGRRRRKRQPRPSAAALIAAAVLLFALVALAVTRCTPRRTEIPQTRADTAFTVCVDAGHGGSDNGASWEGRLEKEDNLRLAEALKQALEDRNVGVIMTRSDDSTLSLEERVEIANAEQADLFISLHRNAAEAGNGVELWVAQGVSEPTWDYAEALRAALVEVGVQKDRGIRSGTQSGNGSYYVLRNTTMPAVLVEMGFMQDGEDNRLFDDKLEDYAAALAEAVVTYWQSDE